MNSVEKVVAALGGVECDGYTPMGDWKPRLDK